MQDSH